MYLRFGSYRLHPHIFFETLSYFVAFRVYLSVRRRFGDSLAILIRWVVIAAAVSGAAIGSKVLYWLEDPRLTLANLHNPAFLMGGKTIVGALIGGLAMVELVKHLIGLRTSTGDLYAIPLALGIAIGRIGCFLTGLADNTYGTATSLPWGIDFGDGVRRHPTQLYEIVFLLMLIPVLYVVLRQIPLRSDTPSIEKNSHFFSGDAFKVFMIAYAILRLLIDFIKPYPRLLLGLGGIQWACVAILLYYAPDIWLWIHPARKGGLATA